MFTKSIRNSLFVISVFLLAACGGGDTSIASPGELGPLDPPSGGTAGSGGSGGNLKTGSCPDSEYIQVGSPVAGNNVCAIQGPITGELTLTDDVMYRMLGKVEELDTEYPKPIFPCRSIAILPIHLLSLSGP